MHRSISSAVMRSAVVAGVFFCAAVSFVSAQAPSGGFSDVPKGVWFEGYVNDAARAGIVSGYADAEGNQSGKFGPSDKVTTIQSLKIAVLAAGYDLSQYTDHLAYRANDWMWGYVEVAEKEKFPSVYQNASQFDRPSTRAELAQLIADAFEQTWSADLENLKDYTDVPASHPNARAIQILTSDDIMVGDGRSKHCVTRDCPKTTFRPTDPINRAEAVKIVMLARQKYGTQRKREILPTRSTSSAPISAVTVRYTSEGFSPRMFTAPIGSEIVFLNESTSPLWVASDPHPAHTGYTGFDAGRIMRQGESFRFTFDRSGIWSYHNHMNPSHQGTVIVE